MTLIQWLGQKAAALSQGTQALSAQKPQAVQRALKAPRVTNAQPPWRYGQKVKPAQRPGV